ncbi:MAG: hypothetical protein ACK5DD_02955 [Cyclobacteriaceae bacterium]|jgi:hypothetical protein
MIIKMPKKASRSEIAKALKNLSKKRVKGFQADKYFGRLVRGIDGVDYQRSVRNEWD